MTCLQCQFLTEPSQSESLEDALLNCGALSIILQDAEDQPILEPGLNETPLWDNLILTALFPADVVVDELLASLSQMLDREVKPNKVEILEDKDWVREWMDTYKPIQFGKQIWICPSWCEPPEPDAINIMLDPGLAFGTGTHPTTAMCLEQLDTLNLEGKTVFDFGCGSGILAIATLLKGAKSAAGTDIDPQALLASRDNADRNHIPTEQFDLFLPGAKAIEPVDVMVANILAGPLVELAPQIQEGMKSGATLLLSGILKEQADTVCAAYTQITFTEIKTQDEWACLQGIKQ